MTNENTKPFGELSKEEKMKLIEAWVDGKEIEFYCAYYEKPTWKNISYPNWYHANHYRVKCTQDFIDWDHVDEEYNYMARDKDGRAWLYVNEPHISYSQKYWVIDGSFAKASAFTSYKQNDAPWQESVVKRPL